jgi:hypothetical protein
MYTYQYTELRLVPNDGYDRSGCLVYYLIIINEVVEHAPGRLECLLHVDSRRDIKILNNQNQTFIHLRILRCRM